MSAALQTIDPELRQAVLPVRPGPRGPWKLTAAREQRGWAVLRADPQATLEEVTAAVNRGRAEPAGTVGFAGAPDADGVVQVGYSVVPELQGHGVATDALRAIVAWAFDHPEVRRVRAMIPPWNAPSIRVAEKGFTRSGTDHDDEVGEVYVYALERS